MKRSREVLLTKDSKKHRQISLKILTKILIIFLKKIKTQKRRNKKDHSRMLEEVVLLSLSTL